MSKIPSIINAPDFVNEAVNNAFFAKTKHLGTELNHLITSLMDGLKNELAQHCAFHLACEARALKLLGEYPTPEQIGRIIERERKRLKELSTLFFSGFNEEFTKKRKEFETQ